MMPKFHIVVTKLRTLNRVEIVSVVRFFFFFGGGEFLRGGFKLFRFSRDPIHN